ncbi:hypothetical protein [Weissella sp. MSCH1]|uniref:hypothetical protein n=1 Tax=Weissella sp. MSCH1 TaxID=3383343 RepID=UPI003896DD24
MTARTLLTQIVSDLNAFDEKYTDLFALDATVSDVASGQMRTGKSDIKSYFKQYFIDFSVQTSVNKINDLVDNHVVADVTFHGDFTDDFAPEGNVDAVLELITNEDKVQTMIIKLIVN